MILTLTHNLVKKIEYRRKKHIIYSVDLKLDLVTSVFVHGLDMVRTHYHPKVRLSIRKSNPKQTQSQERIHYLSPDSSCKID